MYYLVVNGAQQGPYSVGQVSAMVASGEIPSDTLIWTEGQAEWLPLEHVLEVPHTLPSVEQPVATPSTVTKVGIFSFLGGVGVTLGVVGAIILGLLVLVGGLIGYMVYSGNGLDKSSKDYVDQAIPAIVTGWSPDELVKRESKAFKRTTSDEQLMKLFTIFRKLGALKNYEGCKGDANINYTPDSGKVVTATYLGRASFDNGEATIKIILIQEDGTWKIQGFRIDSPVFLK